MNRIEVITTPEGLEAVAHDWDAVLAANPRGLVYLSSFWLIRWMQAFGDPRTNRILLGRNGDGQIIMQAAFELIRENGFSTLRSMSNVHTARTAWNATAEGMTELRKWVAIRSGAAVLRIGRLDIGEGHHGLGPQMHQVQAFELPLIDCSTTHEDFVAGKSRNFRKSLRRALEQQTHLEIVMRPDGHACLDAIRKVSARTWKFREGTAIVSNPDTETFFLSLLDTVPQRAPVTSQLLLMRDTEAGGESVGFMICLCFNSRIYPIKMGLDERIMPLSPGMGALNALVAHTCANPSLDLIDLDACGPHGAYKMRWATRTDTLETTLGFNPGVWGHAAHGLWRLKNKLKPSKPAPAAVAEISGR